MLGKILVNFLDFLVIRRWIFYHCLFHDLNIFYDCFYKTPTMKFPLNENSLQFFSTITLFCALTWFLCFNNMLLLCKNMIYLSCGSMLYLCSFPEDLTLPDRISYCRHKKAFSSNRYFPPTISYIFFKKTFSSNYSCRAVYILDVCSSPFYAFDVKLLLLFCRSLQLNGKTVIYIIL